MPIRGLEAFLIKNYTNKLPIKLIDDTIVAIDGFWFLKKYVSLAGKGGSEEQMTAIVTGLNPLIEMASITQFVWIWDGIDYMNSMYHIKKQGVIKENGKVEPEWFVEIVTEILNKSGIVVMRAPYSAMAQCIYLMNMKYVRYIFTKTDALYFKNGTKIIVNFDFTQKSLYIIDRSELFTSMGFNLYGFQVFAFMCGCEVCYTVPIHANNFKIEEIWELVNSVEKIEDVLRNYVEVIKSNNIFEKTEEYVWLKLFRNSFISVEYHPIMGINGKIEFLNNEYIPNDLSEIFGNILNFYLYQDLFCCKLSPIFINSLVWDINFQDKIMNKSLCVVHKILEKNLNIDKTINISDIIVRLFDLNILFVDELEKLPQILFLLLQDTKFTHKELLLILFTCYNSNDNEKSSFELIQLFGRAYDYFIGIKDIVRLIKIHFFKINQDLNFNIHLPNNLKLFKTPAITIFLKKNLTKDNFEKYFKLLV